MKRATPTSIGSISPPATKRKIGSTTTNRAVASFFKPASQKEPEKITWRIVNKSLIIGKYEDLSDPRKSLERPVKVAAFDLDDTVITAKDPSNRWARSADSWKWWDSCVPGRLKDLYNQGYLVVILSNQATISLKDDPKKLQKDNVSLTKFKTQMNIVLPQLGFPISIYAAAGHDGYRKPRTGMWEEMKEDYDLEGENAIDMHNSFYIGDAAGREKTDRRRKDHATSDRDLAANIGIGFQTPEEFFLGAETEPYNHNFEPADHLAKMVADQSKTVPFSKKHKQELVIFCGSPGAGKSSFYWNVLEPLGYERVNQDILKTVRTSHDVWKGHIVNEAQRDRCIKVARERLSEGKSVAVDNTNADVEVRSHWTKVAQELKIPIRCIRFTASTRLAEHNDAVRALNKEMNPENRTILPGIAFRSFTQRLVEPKLEEGFDDITQVDFKFAGTPEQQRIWSKYWVSKYST